MTDSQNLTISQPSGRAVDDFSPFCEGDTDPTLNKRINLLIDSTEDYIVYLDDTCMVQWSMTDAFKPHEEFGTIANHAAHLETVSMMVLSPNHIRPFRRLLGEALARIVGDKDLEQARAVLKIAEEYLKARGAERARWWYITAAAESSGLCGFLLLLLWILRVDVSAMIGIHAFEVLTGGLVGGVGAFLAILMGNKSLKTDASAGARIHQLDARARVAVGALGAGLLAMAINAEVLFGFSKTFNHRMAFFYMVCFIGGWSERFVKNLVNRVEGLISGKPMPEKNYSES